ncbi:MAG: polysaccharide biosynthesis C-terminal domain-containing protein [Planctomycetota bacterium]
MKPSKIHNLFAMGDQLVVSGSRFLLAVIIARVLGENALGVYSLVISIVYLAITTQQSLISTPFANFRLRPSTADEKNYLQETWLFAAALAVFVGLAMAGAGTILVSLSTSNGVLDLGLAFLWASLAAPFMLMVEFARRAWLIRMQGWRAFVVDSVANCIAVALIAALVVSGRLTVATVFAILAATYLPAAVVCSKLLLPHLKFSRASLGKTAKKHWELGKFIFFSEGLNYGRSNLVLWIIGAFLGIGTTGLYAACHSLMRVINPFFLGVASVAEPKIAAGFATRGKPEARRIAIRVLFVILTGTLPICIAVSLSSHYLLNRIYGPEFAEYSEVVMWLAASIFLASVSYPFSNALQAIDRPDVNFRIRAFVFLIAICGVMVAVPFRGLVGVAQVQFLCAAIAFAIRLYFFNKLTSSCDTAEDCSPARRRSEQT